jgi:hypothetical protein
MPAPSETQNLRSASARPSPSDFRAGASANLSEQGSACGGVSGDGVPHGPSLTTRRLDACASDLNVCMRRGHRATTTQRFEEFLTKFAQSLLNQFRATRDSLGDKAQQIAPGASNPAPCWCANIRASGTPSLLCRTASSGATAPTGVSPPSRGPLRGRSDQRTGSIKCSYCVPGHMTYGLVGSAFASRG